MTVPIVDPEFAAILQPLKPDEAAALEADILKRGCREALLVWNGLLVDGHHRLAICQKHGIAYTVESLTFDSRDEVIVWIVDNQSARRNQDAYSAGEAQLMKKAALARIGKAKMSAGGKGCPELDNLPRHNTLRQLADAAGTSRATMGMIETIAKAAPEELKAKLRAGEITVNRAYDQIRREEARRKVSQQFKECRPPEGKYRCIVIDPPWPIDKIARDVRPNQVAIDYPTMTIEEMRVLPIRELADEAGCHVYLWATHKHIPNALSLFDFWSVRYQCVMTWVKNVGFTPFSWMYSTEHALFGRIGSLDVERKGLRLDFSAKVREHSRKPEEFFERVALASPEPRLEMFARQEREGFTAWGNETTRF